MVAPIRKTEFKDPIFVIPSASAISDIFKTMIFINLIDETTEMVKYLLSRLSEQIKTIKRPDMIIQAFSANLIAKSLTRFLKDLCNGETQVWVYMKYIGLSINLCNILRVF